MKNGKCLIVFSDINYLIDCSQNKSYKVQDGEGRIIEVREIKQYLEMPVQISSILIRNKMELKSIVDQRDELIKLETENFKASNSFDEEKANTDKEYQKSFYEDLNNFLESNKSALYSFLEEESKIKLKTIKLDLSEETQKNKKEGILHLKKIDPRGLFKINYIPFSLIEEGIVEFVD